MNPLSLIGTWKLVSGRIVDGHGRLLDEVVDGLLQYTAGGYVSAHCVMAAEARDPAARAALGGDYVAYFGTYALLSERPAVSHRIQGCNVPSYVGKVLVREVELAGDLLTLTARMAAQAEVDAQTQVLMVWQRLE